MNAIINLGKLLAAIEAHHWTGFAEAAAHCHVSKLVFTKLAEGRIPRLDALFRVCQGLNLKVEDLIIGTHKAAKEPGANVVSGRWPDKQIARDEG